jgi:hypothetical protein
MEVLDSGSVVYPYLPCPYFKAPAPLSTAGGTWEYQPSRSHEC